MFQNICSLIIEHIYDTNMYDEANIYLHTYIFVVHMYIWKTKCKRLISNITVVYSQSLTIIKPKPLSN